MNDNSRKRILVTGAAGFIGSFLCPKLIEKGYAVTALDIDEKNTEKTAEDGDRGYNMRSDGSRFDKRCYPENGHRHSSGRKITTLGFKKNIP